MALQIHSPSTLLTPKPYHHHHHLLLLSPPKPIKLTTRCQKPTTDTEPTKDTSSPTKKPAAPGQGFGSSSSSSTSPASVSKQSKATTTSSSSSKKKQKGKGGRASVIRRSPVEKPSFVGQIDEVKLEEQKRNESAFLLTWLGLGGIILVQGILLSASGFLPDEWDKLFVKYLYPSFTPTILLFLAGTVGYGVLKYIQNEKLKDQN
ncbi:hypothetical protein Tsubulata_022860 [Turnera subulata]|uniref:Protein LOW PSII ACCUMULATION 2, chloroplastic n=1 Tax=Turnera subulata TaxID=218843 RepID=A0A9Q0FBC4_9ROSI|nr:hypothetical protein Tsubulata_022860 [Turnera subulata]